MTRPVIRTGVFGECDIMLWQCIVLGDRDSSIFMDNTMRIAGIVLCETVLHIQWKACNLDNIVKINLFEIIPML